MIYRRIGISLSSWVAAIIIVWLLHHPRTLLVLALAIALIVRAHQ